jgi:hypothetical protein
MDATSLLNTIAERVERELECVRDARPALASRVSRAEGILVTHLSCRRQRVIRVRALREHLAQQMQAMECLGDLYRDETSSSPAKWVRSST